MSKTGKKLIEAANEARAIARGEADPATYNVYPSVAISPRPWRVEWVHAEAHYPHGPGWYILDTNGVAVCFCYRGADARAIAEASKL